MKPFINLDDLEMEGEFADGSFQQRFGEIASKIGARKLGYNLTIVPPGKRPGPYHNHRNNEEMFFIIDGTGLLRFGRNEYPIRRNDVIACPPGGRDVAHQFLNTGDIDLRYLAVSTVDPVEIAEFPDSNKVMSYVGHGWQKDFRHISRADQAVDYMDGES